MGSRGPKPLPTAVKIARGTFQPCRANQDEPKIIPQRPPDPEGLDPEERMVYDRWADILLTIGVLSAADGAALRDLACADVRVTRARAEAKKHGMVQVDEKGTTKPSGYARELDAARADFSRLCACFGVTPSDRTKVKASPPKKTEKTEQEKRRELFFGKTGGA